MSEYSKPGFDSKLWTKNFILILVANFAVYIGFYMLLPTLPIYVKILSGEETLSGFAMGVFLVSAVLIRPFAGRAVDTRGRKGIFLLGLIIFFLCSLVFNWVHTLLFLFLFRFIQGFGWGYCNTASGAIAADIIPKTRLAEGMGYFGLSMSIAMGLAPALALFIIGKYSFNLMFYVSAFAVVLATLLAIFMNYHNPKKDKAEVKPVLIEKAALRPSLVAFFVTLNYSSVLSFLALYGQHLNIPNIGLFFTVYAISITISRPLFGRIADKRGYDIVMIPGLMIISLTMLILFKAQSLPAFILAGIIYGCGFGAVQPTLQAMSVLNVPPNRRGAATGTYFTFFDLGVGLGSILWGVVAHAIGYSLMYLLVIIPTLAALTIYLVLARRSHRSPEDFSPPQDSIKYVK